MADGINISQKVGCWEPIRIAYCWLQAHLIGYRAWLTIADDINISQKVGCWEPIRIAYCCLQAHLIGDRDWLTTADDANISQNVGCWVRESLNSPRWLVFAKKVGLFGQSSLFTCGASDNTR